MTMTRADFGWWLATWLELPLDNTGGFTDTAGTYIDAGVTALKDAGIITGVGGDRFAPLEPITRAQAVTMLARAFKIPALNVNSFSDVPAGSYYAGFANALADLGVVGVDTGGKFMPDEVLTQSQLDSMVSRLLTAGYGPGMAPAPPGSDDDDEYVTGGDQTGDTGQDEQTASEEVEPTEDFLTGARTMLRNLGIEIDEEVNRFIDAMWDNDWDRGEIDLQLKSGEWGFYKRRFPGIFERRDKGLPDITGQEYVEMEAGYREAMRRANFPRGFYDSPEIFHDWIGNDRSVVEVTEDIIDQFERVAGGEPEVLEYFQAVFGPNEGIAGLAAFYLDPSRGAELLEEAASMAEIGGTALRHDFDLTADRARQLAELGVGLDQARRGFGELVAMTPIFEETVGERFGEDLDEMDEGLDVAFQTEGGRARQALEHRMRTRLSRFAGGSAAAADESGVFGLGTAS